MAASHVNLWTSPAHALDYLRRADSIPHRTEGEAVPRLFAAPAPRRPRSRQRNGRLLELVKLARPEANAVALDFSPTMLDEVRHRFAADSQVHVLAHDLDHPLPPLGAFDAIVSSFATHHLPHGRKRALYAEIFARLTPGGVFCNLEHVASPTERLPRQFLAALSSRPVRGRPLQQTAGSGNPTELAARRRVRRRRLSLEVAGTGVVGSDETGGVNTP
jgi:tRNA (cmo5U34)-methyltransferase